MNAIAHRDYSIAGTQIDVDIYLQVVTDYKSRSQFWVEVINPLIDEEIIYRDGNVKSPKSLIKLKDN